MGRVGELSGPRGAEAGAALGGARPAGPRRPGRGSSGPGAQGAGVPGRAGSAAPLPTNDPPHQEQRWEATICKVGVKDVLDSTTADS